ncbi:MAG: hypothetical protein GY950_29845 [bacterium]|nr:hypothetical protein [bacterium]
MTQLLSSRTIIILMLAGIFALSVNMPVQAVNDVENKQFVQITMKNGDNVSFDYRSFMRENFQLLEPVLVPRSSQNAGADLFMLKRVLFKESASCETIGIGLANLEEMEFIGIGLNQCAQKDEWMFRIRLLDRRAFVGVFQTDDAGMDRAMSGNMVKGRLLVSEENRSLKFDEIQRISFVNR